MSVCDLSSSCGVSDGFSNPGQVRQRIRTFLQDPSPTAHFTVPDTIRKLIRNRANFMPDVADLHIHISLHLLMSNRLNVQCLYHHQTKRALPNDADPAKGTKVAGVPHARKVVKKQQEAQRLLAKEDPLWVEPGYLGCGCSEYSALLELIWWKRGSITSPTTGAVDAGGALLDPRQRAFVIDEWHRRTGLRLDDLYAYKECEEMKKFRVEQGATAVAMGHLREGEEAASTKGKGKGKGKKNDREMSTEEELRVVHRGTELDVLEIQVSRLAERLKSLKLEKESVEAEKKNKKDAKKAANLWVSPE